MNKLNIDQEQIIENTIKIYQDEKFISEFKFDFTNLKKIFFLIINDTSYITNNIYRNVEIKNPKIDFCLTKNISSFIQAFDQFQINNISGMIEKYIEYNLLLPFKYLNGYVMRVWLDLMILKKYNKLICWNKINQKQYFEYLYFQKKVLDFEFIIFKSVGVPSDLNLRKSLKASIEFYDFNFQSKN
ncbi:hypothetical protein GE118_03495 [Mycoplasma sp. NEAQ87857]|uniref:hypothetical protein n=1 Tax=Mycoplasma sp. NEAQ87857 TaxID=2683967 RepID=UPI00131601F4|nr:hypothetical protein [Mycoplasma sp. NEAQ87857]QGZ97849.1 hypothetical protein GE118_03495 [Mycoplasma sp. NEAQ87857]